MGDVAASGGYYIAANSNKIFAESNTITGSIGVFGMIPNTRELYEKHMGLTMDTVKTGRFSTMSSDGGMFYAFNEEEGKMITESIEEIYDIFKTRVSEGRTKSGVSLMNRAHVDTIAEGRVWLGNVAKKIGLVDELGGLDDAIKSAAKLANLSDYKVSYYPKVKSFEDELLSFGKGDDKKAFLKPEMIQDALSSSILGEDFASLLKTVREIKNTKGVQARLPYEIIIR
jgi:protease-4